MHQKFLTDREIKEYLALEQFRRHLAKEVKELQNAMQAREPSCHKSMTEQKRSGLETQLNHIVTQLSNYGVSIEPDIMQREGDAIMEVKQLTGEQKQMEIERLENRCNALRIKAALEEGPVTNLKSRLYAMTLRIHQLKNEGSLSSVSLFKPDEPRDLRTSAGMRATLRSL